MFNIDLFVISNLRVFGAFGLFVSFEVLLIGCLLILCFVVRHVGAKVVLIIYSCVFIGLIAMQTALNLLLEFSLSFTMLFLGTGLVWLPFVLKERSTEQENENPREFIKFIDGQIKRANTSDDTLNEGEILPTRSYNTIKRDAKAENQEEKATFSDYELDFKHVRNVIERMESFPLSVSDRRQVSELENSILTAERGGFTRENKEKINDGLSALLKIMSKYGA